MRYTRLSMTDPTPIDITNMSELARIAEEVEATKIPRFSSRKNKTVAVLVPTTHVPGRKTDKTSVKEALALAGAWGERNWDEVAQHRLVSIVRNSPFFYIPCISLHTCDWLHSLSYTGIPKHRWISAACTGTTNFA